MNVAFSSLSARTWHLHNALSVYAHGRNEALVPQMCQHNIKTVCFSVGHCRPLNLKVQGTGLICITRCLRWIYYEFAHAHKVHI